MSIEASAMSIEASAFGLRASGEAGRLLLAAVFFLGCGKAEAVPVGAELPVPQAPAGWSEMPDMAGAIAAAAHVGTGDVHAWGEPARGCYAAWLGVAEAAGSDAVERDLRGVAGLTVHDVAHPAPGEIALAFERAPYRGRLRAATGGTRLTALACFWNEREPAACAAACAKLLGGAP